MNTENTEITNNNNSNLEAVSLKVLVGLLLVALALLGWGLKLSEAENASLRTSSKESSKELTSMAEKSAMLVKESERALASIREAKEREVAELREVVRLMEKEAQITSAKIAGLEVARNVAEGRSEMQEVSLAAYKAANEALAKTIPQQGWKAKAFQWLQ